MGRPGIARALALAAGSAHAQVQVTSPLPGVRLAVAVNNGNPSALLVVDLCAPGVTVRTTRYDERGALAADWAARTGVDLAVNGDLFDFGAYSVAHWARSGGVDWPAGTHNQEPHPNIAFGPGLAMRGDVPPPSAANDVIGGIPEILIDGALNPSLADTDFINGPHRRTAVGLSQDRRTLFIFSTDGTASVPGVAFGLGVLRGAVPGAPPVWWALNLDGGGSSQMWVRGPGTVIPSTRPVANHLGIFARGSGPATHCPVRDAHCPMTGSAQACLDRTHIGDCLTGTLVGNADCSIYGAVCAAARPAGPGCVIGFCLPDPSRAPWEHDACGYDGRLTHCAADGSFGNPRTCPAGTTCQAAADGTATCAIPGTTTRDAGLDASFNDVASTPSDVVTADRGNIEEPSAAGDAGPANAMDGSVDRGLVTGACGCRTTSGRGAGGSVASMILLGVAQRRRRRRSIA